MMLDFTGSENEIVAGIQAMIAHRMPSEKPIRLPGGTKASREAAYRENLERRETFLQDWATFLVFIRDQHGFKLDLHEAWRLLRWERLCELCDPKTLIGRSLQGRLMRKYVGRFPASPALEFAQHGIPAARQRVQLLCVDFVQINHKDIYF